VTPVPEPRSVVVTGASRGLGLATAAHLRRAGWTVVAAARRPDEAVAAVRAAAGRGTDDPGVVGVRLDLDDPTAITHAADATIAAVGAPDAVVHNAGIAGVGSVEEMPAAEWERIVGTNFLGPVRLTAALLPAMRDAGRGRFVLVSSMGGLRGMPGIGAYSAAKSALERWGESLAYEVSPFGIGVTVVVTGTFKTDILELTPTYADAEGPWATFHEKLEGRGRRFTGIAADPSRFARVVERSLEDRRPFVRRTAGIDARMLLAASRTVPSGLLHAGTRLALGLPGPGALRDPHTRPPTASGAVEGEQLHA